MCYYAIEVKYKNNENTDEYSTVLRDLTNSRITDDGKVQFKNGTYINQEYISKLHDEHIRKLLSQLVA